MSVPVGGMPPVQYARNLDLNIAYQVVGDGPVDVLLVPGFISHIEYAWHEVTLNRFLRKLAGFARVICFDKRGMGLSDRDPDGLPPTIEQRAEDMLTVLDAVGSRSAAVLGWSEGGPTSVHFAHCYPDRVSALILIATTPRFTADADFPEGIPLDIMEIFIETLRSDWGTGVGFELHAPSVADDSRLRSWWASYQRLAATPGAIEQSLRMHLDVDVRKLLPELSLPTLVVHQEQDMVIPVECGRYLADHVPGAQYLERRGTDHLFWLGDQDQTIDAIAQVMARTEAGAALPAMRRTQRRARAGWDSITGAEQKIADLVAVGLTNRQIADRLSTSARTVQTHVTHILAKLNLAGRSELAAEVTRREAF